MLNAVSFINGAESPVKKCREILRWKSPVINYKIKISMRLFGRELFNGSNP
jgi:hypothetical protein